MKLKLIFLLLFTSLLSFGDVISSKTMNVNIYSDAYIDNELDRLIKNRIDKMVFTNYVTEVYNSITNYYTDNLVLTNVFKSGSNYVFDDYSTNIIINDYNIGGRNIHMFTNAVSMAFGLDAEVTDDAVNSIQLGTGTNSTSGSLKYRNYLLLNNNGYIPFDRLKNILVEPDLNPNIPLGRSVECTRSSNWFGKNAEHRLMNMLSPSMPNRVFNEYCDFLKTNDVNTVHLILANKGDGEYTESSSHSGYSIYGPNFNIPNIDDNTVFGMTRRLRYLKFLGFKIVLWLTTDDSDEFNIKIKNYIDKYVSDLRNVGILDYATSLCIGLEVNEYWNDPNIIHSIFTAVRRYYPRYVGVHTSTYLNTLGFSEADIIFLQFDPSDDEDTIEIGLVNIKNNYPSKLINLFEISRSPARDRCKIGPAYGAYGVGNW